MDAPVKSLLKSTQLDLLIERFPVIEIVANHYYNDEGDDIRAYSSKDHVIEFDSFDIEAEIDINEVGRTFRSSHLNPCEYTQEGLNIHVGQIRIISSDCSNINLSGTQYQTIKKQIIKSIAL